MPGSLFEESRVFNIKATAIDSTVCSNFIIAAGYYKTVVIDTAFPDDIRTIKIPHKFISKLACHPRVPGELAMVAGAQIEMYSLDTMKPRKPWLQASGGPKAISDFVWHPHDPFAFATCSPHEMIKVWDTRIMNDVVLEVGCSTGATQMKYSPIMDHIIVAANNEMLSIWDERNPHTVVAKFDVASHITCVNWHPRDRHTFMTSSKDEMLRSWDFFNPEGELMPDTSGYSRYCPCWRFWFSPDGEEYAVAKSPLALKPEGQLEVYQYPFHENTNPLKNDNSDIFIDLCWNKHPEKNSKFVWALRQSKGIVRHAIVFDYSENREEMSTPIAQTAADEEYDRLVEPDHSEVTVEPVPIVEVEAEPSKEVLSPPHPVNIPVPSSPEDLSPANMHMNVNNSNRCIMRSLPSSYDAGTSHIANLVSRLRQSPSTSSLKSMAKEIATRPTVGSLSSPIAIPINDFERYMYAPNIHGCDLIHELEMLSECVIDGITMTETNFPRAAIGFTYEHHTGAPKIEYELRYHKDFRHNGKILVKILQKDDCPLSGSDARELLRLMQDLSLKLVGDENAATPTTSVSASFRNMPTIMTKVVRDLRKLVDQLHVFPGGDVPDTVSTATKPIAIPIQHVEEVLPSEGSENSLRQSFSLNFTSSVLDNFVPAPRTSGAQFDSSGFLVRFGNFRTAVRKPPRSESKLSINGSISQYIQPMDYPGVVDVDSDDDHPTPKTNQTKPTGTIFSQVPTQKINSGSSLSDEEIVRSECLPDGENSTEFDLNDNDSGASAQHSTSTTSESSEPHSESHKDNVSGYESSENESTNTSSGSESEHMMDQISLPAGPSGGASDDEIIFADIEVPLEGSENAKESYPPDDYDSESDVCVITETVEQVTNELHEYLSDSEDEAEKVKVLADDDNLEPIEVLSLEEIAEKGFYYDYPPYYEPRSPEVVFEESESDSDSSFVSDLETLSKTRFSKRQRKPEVRKKVASVLLTAPKSSLFPFGDSVTTPKTFQEYINRMGPILHEIGTKMNNSKMLNNSGFGDSPPSSLPRGDEANTSRVPQAFHCASPIQSFSLSSSPTPAAIILQRNNPRTRLSSYPANRRTSSVRIRGGSLTLTDADNNMKASSSDALVSTPVEVFDISYYLPVSKRLAKFYKMQGRTGPKRLEHIRHNVKVAWDSRRGDLIDTWGDVKKYANAIAKIKPEPICHCNSKLCPAVIKGKCETDFEKQCRQLRDKREREMRVILRSWEEGQLNTAFFIERLKAHLYHKDVQTVAAVTCALGQYCKLPKKRNDLNRGPEGPTGFGLMRSSSANTGDVGLTGDGKTQRSASIAGAPAPLHEKQSRDSETKPTYLRKISETSRPRSSSIDEAALGHLMTADSGVHATAALLGLQIVGGDSPCLIFHSSEGRVAVPEVPKSTDFEDDNPLVVGRAFDEFEDARVSYGEILSRWGMYKQAAEVYKFCPTQQPEPFVERVFCDKCQEPVFGDNLGKCQRCKGPSISCALCQRPCTGLLLTCPRCSHGGHVDHIRRWFREQSACPLGCGCICPF